MAHLQRINLHKDDPPVIEPADRGGGGNISPKKIIAYLRIIPKMKQIIIRFLPNWLLKRYQILERRKLVESEEKQRLRGERPLDSNPAEFINQLRANLAEIIGDIQKRQIGVILCTYPNLISFDNIQEYPEIFLEGRRFCVELSYEGMIDASDKVDSLMFDMADRYGIPIADVHRLIPKDTSFFADIVHMTDKGAELMAKSLMDLILSKYGKGTHKKSDVASGE